MFKLTALFLFITVANASQSLQSRRKGATLKPMSACCNIPELGDPRPLSECSNPKLPGPCNDVQCIFEKSGFLTNENTLNKEAYKTHLRKWSENHSGWSKAVDRAIEDCVNKDLRQYLAYPCKAYDVFTCTGIAMLKKCPESAWNYELAGGSSRFLYSDTLIDTMADLRRCAGVVYITLRSHGTATPQETNMIRGCVLFAVFQVILAQGQPPDFPPIPPADFPKKCLGPPPILEKPHECCKIPPFFEDEDFAACGFQKLDDEAAKRKHGPPDCSKQICMLKKYNLLLEDEGIDNVGISEFLNKWSAKNEVFKPAVDKATEQCLGKQLIGPPQICEANKLVFCISSTIFDNCPTWQETEGCTALKAHMEECRPFYRKH